MDCISKDLKLYSPRCSESVFTLLCILMSQSAQYEQPVHLMSCICVRRMATQRDYISFVLKKHRQVRLNFCKSYRRTVFFWLTTPCGSAGRDTASQPEDRCPHLHRHENVSDFMQICGNFIFSRFYNCNYDYNFFVTYSFLHSFSQRYNVIHKLKSCLNGTEDSLDNLKEKGWECLMYFIRHIVGTHIKLDVRILIELLPSYVRRICRYFPINSPFSGMQKILWS